MLFQQSGPMPTGVVQLLGRPQNAPPSSQSAQFSFTLPPRRLEAFEDELSLGGREGIDLREGADLGRILMDETDSIVSAAMAHGGRMDPGVPGSGRGVYSSAGPEGRHSFYDPRAHPHSRPLSAALTNEVPVAVELLQRHLRDLLVQRLTVTEELPQSLSPPHTSPLPPSNPIVEDSEGMAGNTPGPLPLSDRDVSLTAPGGDSQVEMDIDIEAAAAEVAAGAGAAGTAAVVEVAVAAQDVEEEPFEQYLINLMDQLSPPNVPPQDPRRPFSIPVPEPGTATLPVAVAASSPSPIVPTADEADLAAAEPLTLTALPDNPAPATATSSLDLLTLDLTLIIDTLRETSNTSTDTGPITADLGSSSLPIPRHDRIPESNNESEVLESDEGEGLSSVEGHGIPLSYPSSSTVQREVALPASDDVITGTSPHTGGSPTNDPQTRGAIPLNLDTQLEGGAAIEVEVQNEGGSEDAVVVVESGEGGGGGGARAIACPAGYEPDVFYSLPEFMQQEVADQHQEVGGSDQTRALVEVRMHLNDIL